MAYRLNNAIFYAQTIGYQICGGGLLLVKKNHQNIKSKMGMAFYLLEKTFNFTVAIKLLSTA